MNLKRISAVCAVFWGLSSSTAFSQQPHGHEHGKPADFKMPTTFKEAVNEIRMRLHEIDELITTKKLEDVHGQAEVIQKVGNIVGQLSLKSDSGVPREAVKEVNKAGRELANMFDAIDKAGDSGDAAGTRKLHSDMVKLSDVLYNYSPKDFACPMKCEGQKIYPTAQKCPVCGMALQDVNAHQDHSAKHGGTFFMAQDQKHHLEGTISDKREFRVYFYDEFTKPIAARKFTAQGTTWTRDKDAEKPLRLRPASDEAFLSGQVDASIEFPIRIKMFIDFKDGQEPQVFDFDFDVPSNPAAEDKAVPVGPSSIPTAR